MPRKIYPRTFSFCVLFDILKQLPIYHLPSFKNYYFAYAGFLMSKHRPVIDTSVCLNATRAATSPSITSKRPATGISDTRRVQCHSNSELLTKLAYKRKSNIQIF